MVAKVKKKTPKKKDLRIAQGTERKFPMKVMGVTVKNQQELNKMVNSVRGESSWNKRGSLGS